MYSRKQLINLFIPVFAEQFLSTAIGVVNTMMVSGLGAYAVSAVGIVDSINFVAMNLFVAVSTGATVKIAQLLGAEKGKEASKTAAQSIVAVLLMSTMAGLGLYIFGNQIINFMFGNAEQMVKASARTYMICSAISYPVLGVFDILTAVLRANRNFRASMKAVVASNLANLIIGFICIMHFNLGVLGAGIGLICARLTGTLLLLNPLFKCPRINILKSSFIPTVNILKPVLFIGIPAGLDSIIFNGGKLLVQSIVASLGTADLAANGIASSINVLAIIPGNAICIVAVTLVGFYAGAGDREELNKIIKKILIASMLLLGIVTLIFYPFVGYFLKLYRPEPEVYHLALNTLHLTFICMPLFWPLGFVLPACLRSTGDVLYITAVSILSMWIVRVLGGFLLVRYTSLGLMGVWVAWCSDWVTRGVPFLWRVIKRGYEKYLPPVADK